LEKIKHRYTQFGKKAFNIHTGKLYLDFMMLLNGKPVYDYTQKLKEGDILVILPVVAGG
jgi:molybdopterin converting factor small subunit